MAENKNPSRDITILKHLRNNQTELKNEIEYFKISQASDLTPSETLRPVVRRGLVQMVGDIFELTNGLRDETKMKIGINLMVIRQFRNTASHNYGVLSNAVIFACIKHCVDKVLMQNIADEILRLENDMKEN